MIDLILNKIIGTCLLTYNFNKKQLDITNPQGVMLHTP